jgi:DNA replication protein DnaC
MAAKNNYDSLKEKAKALGLYGVLSHWEQLGAADWLPKLIECEEQARAKRGLERRTKRSRVGRFKPLADFDWSHPQEIDRARIEELFSLEFIADATNIILVGPSGAGKTMIAQNLAHHAVLQGYTSLFISASALLHDLAEQRTGSALAARLKHYARPDILVIDELGYFDPSTSNAEHLFELVTRRYQSKPIVLTSNLGVSQWNGVFPSSACLVPMVDRLIHYSEIFTIDVNESFRLKDARAREALRTNTLKERQA